MKRLSHALDQLASPQFFVPWCEALLRFCHRRRGEFSDLGNISVKRILVVKLDRIGDVILALPFLRELRRRFPQARISLVADKRVCNLLENNPYVDELFLLTCKTWSPSSPTARWKDLLTATVFAATRLWCRRFDLAITLSWDTDNHYAGAIAYLSGAPRRLGFSEQTNEVKRVANANYDLLYTHVLNEPADKHEVEHNLHLITAFGATPVADTVEIRLHEADERFAMNLLSAQAITGNGPLVAVCPSAAVPYKVWPVERFSQLSQWIIDRYGARILVVGSTNDSAIAEQLKRSLRGQVLNCAGVTSLRQCAALLKNCQLYVGNDTAPMHMAAAFQVPVVAVSAHPADGAEYQGISPLRFGPWKTKAIVVQPPLAQGSCAHTGRTADGVSCAKWCDSAQAHCILQVSLESVQEAVAEMMNDLSCSSAGIASGAQVPV
jgi:heptosyltransferase-2